MNPLEALAASLARLPGLGKKSAVRMAFHLLKADQGYNQELGHLILTIKDRVKKCSHCGNYTEIDLCPVCSDFSRDKSTICVVEQVQDLLTIHASGEYRGLFHVLHGVISPMDGIGPEELGLTKLLQRVRAGAVQELILATNATLEGDTTALYIGKMFSGEPNLRITRLASGIPVGGDLEYTDRLTLARSLKGRVDL